MTNNDLLLALSDMLDNKFEKEIQPIKSDLKDMKSTINNVQSEVRTIQSEVRTIQSEVRTIQSEVENIQLTLENETNRNIKLIAEGHLNLSRKLSESLKIDSEKEMLAIRVNVLENELRQIKDRLSTIA